jgi:hypothetical protein
MTLRRQGAPILGPTRSARAYETISFVTGVVGLLFIAATLVRAWGSSGFVPWDALTYYNGAERLFAGRDLYVQSPADTYQHIQPGLPGFLNPPLMAVIWEPLFLLPWGMGLAIWWIACALTVLGVLAVVEVGGHGWTILLLAPAIAWELGVANVNSLILGGIALTYIFTKHGRDREAGLLVAVLAGLKLTPAIVVFWLIGTRRWVAVRWFFIGGFGALAASILVAGIDTHLDYLALIRSQGSSLGELSIAKLLVAGLGMPSVIGTIATWAAVSFGAMETLVLGGLRPRLAWTVIVTTMAVGGPVVNPNTFALLLLGVVPYLRMPTWTARRPVDKASYHAAR